MGFQIGISLPTLQNARKPGLGAVCAGADDDLAGPYAG